MCLCSQLCRMQYLWPELLGTPPPSSVAIVVICACDFLVEGILYPLGGKVCLEGEAMGLMVLHGWRG